MTFCPVSAQYLPPWIAYMAEVSSSADSPPRKSRAVAKQPLDALAIARLGDLMCGESDTAVWRSALDAVGHSGEEPAVRMARLALGQPDGEVRRRGCEYLAAHPDPAHEVFLASLLADPDQAVAVAAIRAIGAAGKVQDAASLRTLLASGNEELQLETAIALCRLHDFNGLPAMERLSYSGDLMIRTRVARAVGELGDVRLAGVLMRLLDDRTATVNCAALAALPKITGRDAAQSEDGATVPVADQIARWKKWFAERQERNGS